MDIEGRLHSARRRSQMTMRKFVQSAGPADAIQRARPPSRTLRAQCAAAVVSRQVACFLCVLSLASALSPALHAQDPQPTGPQQLSFAGLRAGPDATQPAAQINAIRISAQGNLYLLIDQRDGVRLLETDPTATNILAQAQLGAQGDIGLAMALDPAGNIYVTGTTTSGAMTATSAAAFPKPSGTSTNSFVAKFDASLNPLFITFAGGGSIAATSIAATSDAVFITGSIFSATLPVTASAILQTPAYGSMQNGFVEKFSANGSVLLYATYLSGASGSTTPAAIAADTSDSAYIAGTTTSPGYPTFAALVPEVLAPISGFLTKLTPAGDGITFSTYIPGEGITSLAIDPVANNLLLSGSVSLGQFPITTVSSPLTAILYQSLLRISLDGSTVLGSTVLAPGSQSFVAPGAAGTVWVAGSLSLPILPLTPLSTVGNSFAVHVNAANVVDQTARFGGIAPSNPGNAAAPVAITSIAADPSGNALFAGSFAPYASQSLLATQTFDLPLTSVPTPAFPSTVRAAVLPASACNGSLCAGSAAYLAKLTIPASPSASSASLALSVDDSPNLTLRNLATAEATGLQIAVTGFTFATNCTSALPAGGECSIALTGSGPGTVTSSSANASTQSAALPALTSGTAPLPIVFSPKELDFGIVSSASGPVTRTITVTNLTQQSQTFTSAIDIGIHSTLQYTFAESASDCALAGVSTKLLAPGGACHITLGLTASNSPTNDGPIQQNWLIGTRDVQTTAYAQAAALSLSAAEIDFGTQYSGGLRPPRYLYLSNNSTTAIEHAAVTLPTTSPFSITDACPALLEPLTVCQLQLAYQAAHTPSADSVTLSLDQGLTALVTGTTLAPPAIGGPSVNPSLNVSATSLNFADTVAVTSASASTQTLTIQNTGASAFPLTLALTGDFTDTTNCGSTLPGNSSCSIVFTLVPSQPGTRQGLLAITTRAGTSPVYVTLSGVGAGILAPVNNGTLNFGSVPAGQPSIRWIKVTQPFASFTAATASSTLGSPFTAVLVEDIGYGHGQPPSSAFTTRASGTCFNCWLGVQFTPASTGLDTGTLTLTSSTTGSPYVLALTGDGLPITGLLLTPAAQDFGPVPVNSASPASLFTLTNLVPGGNSIAVAPPNVTGDFAISATPSGGAPCGITLAYTASCFIEIAFTPTTSGPRTGTLTAQAGSLTATAALIGYGSPDPGLSLNPSALIFNNVPGTSSAQQTIVVTNTSNFVEQIATPIPSPASAFTAATNCATLVPAATCTIAVTYNPTIAPATGTLILPITSSIGGEPTPATYAIPLTGAYTSEGAGLEIISNDVQYGPQATGSPAVPRQFTVNNLTAKSLAVTIALPRQFVLSGAPCSSLAPVASCNFSVAFLPLNDGDITGTLLAQGTPADGSPVLSGLGYVEGYGIGAGTLSITGGAPPGGALSFGQIPSGKSAQRTLSLTNASATSPLTVRRVTSGWPFLSTTTCGATLAPSASCTVTLAYTPINQVATGSSSSPALTDTGTLILESDAASSPDVVDLTGASTSVTVASPSNMAPIAALTASQSSLTFANTIPGSISAPQAVTLANTGTSTIAILGIQTTPNFTVAGNCPTIQPGANCPLTITFTPQTSTAPDATTRISAIEISSNATTSLEFISLVGESNPSTLTVAPTSLNFGAVVIGSTTALSVELSNTGSSPATLTSITATGDYSIGTGTCPTPTATLAPGTNCALEISFTPMQSGTLAGTLTIASSSVSAPLTVPLTGVGIQSHLQITPASLSFGSIAVGTPASLSLTLANTGTAPITGLALAITGDYAITQPCPYVTLAPGSSCSVTVTFSPTAPGTRSGTLTITSSDASSPAAVSLTGSGFLSGTFTLTASGSNIASATVASGSPAAYSLIVMPLNGFTGTVVLNCTPIVPATYASCSLVPSSVTLSTTAQTAIATLTTATSIASAAAPHKRNFADTYLCLLFPTIVFIWKSRTSRHRAWRAVGPIAWAIFASIALLTAGGCGGDSITPTNLRDTPAGAYQFKVSATPTVGSAPPQTVTLNLIVQ